MDGRLPRDALPDHRGWYVGGAAQRHRRTAARPAARPGAGQGSDAATVRPPRAAQGVAHEGSTPFQKSLGLLISTDDDRIVVEMDIRDNLRGPAGSLEGGVLSTLIDVAAGAASVRAMGMLVATQDMTIHFLAPGKVGPMRASGEVLRARNGVAVIEVRVTDVGKDDRLCSTALVTMRALPNGEALLP